MARTADHEQRRRQVAEALMAVVGERGLARTTLADVADHAGVSVGLVQRYFRSKAQLLRFGVEHMYHRAEQRLQEVSDGPVSSVRDWLDRATETLLPLDDERVRELTVWLEFLPAALADPEMLRMHRETTRTLADALIEALEIAVREGELPADRDPRAEAVALIACVDGLTLHHIVTAEPFTAEAIRTALTTHLDRLFTAPESPRTP
ncbi:TetR/AcrR family transcriptional regulator [Nocardiopsis changdeensis]|uniref:TetR family transcriptional regulator n=1 Tax=Nocardiopsis changdeensis TaxID=2831969 RepID=A0ABX8BKR2_9ACTN|nr:MULTISPECIES: TetR family transcriptional regulator C-terminal domain-containing protein [Nocardiopsis]QUX22315.1 TetR family transcriptional regulator [Nocardiopsis changdeensis]QYX38256.1 TetR family transcriptional regulator [Nocardiopsis sp. MT53]